VTPQIYYPQPAAVPTEGDAQQRMMQRYGIGGGRGGSRYGGGGAAGLGGIEYRGIQPQQPVYQPPVQPTGVTTPVKSGPLPTVLDERQLKVTINLILVKLLPPKAK
jgi:hypothetical protein